MLEFEWDDAKARSNKRKHGVSFDVAMHAFDDPDAMFDLDRVVDGEPRWQTLGLVADVLLLMVANTIRQETGENEIIRIISARRADRRERQRYEENRKKNRIG